MDASGASRFLRFFLNSFSEKPATICSFLRIHIVIQNFDFFEDCVNKTWLVWRHIKVEKYHRVSTENILTKSVSTKHVPSTVSFKKLILPSIYWHKATAIQQRALLKLFFSVRLLWDLNFLKKFLISFFDINE